jgi:thiol-disulfide isomerase/thioredoxin
VNSEARSTTFPRAFVLVALATGFVLAPPFASAPARAQDASLLQGFQATSDYELEIDGTVDTAAEIYFQQRLPGYLVLPSKVTTPFLLVPRSRDVRAVHVMKISRQASGALDLAPDALWKSLGQFELVGTDLVFSTDGKRFVVRQKPPLLGLVPATGLEAYDDRYRERAVSYQPTAAAMQALKAEKRDVRVRVYFGSWCPFCQQYLPRIVRVAHDLAGSKVGIDFYGLSRDFSEDDITRTVNVRSVPTAVVLVDGKEAGRIQGEDWRAPEKALQKILGS